MDHSPPFLLTVPDRYHFEKDGAGSEILHVHLRAEAAMLRIEDYRELKERWGPERMIWVSGGGAYVLDRTWIPLVQRSLDSPSNPGLLTVATGRSDTYQELLEPSRLLRELVEEIVILDQEGFVLVPDLTELSSLIPGWSSAHLEDHVMKSMAPLKLGSVQSRRRRALCDESLRQDHLVVHQEQKRLDASRCLLHWNADSGEVNVLFLVHLDVEGIDLRRCRFLDTECRPPHEGGEPLRRPVFLYELTTGRIYSCPDGYPQFQEPTYGLELTAHAQYLVDHYRNASRRSP